MKDLEELVDLWVHDGLSNKRQSAVADLIRFFEPLGQHARRACVYADQTTSSHQESIQTSELVNEAVVVLHGAVDDDVRLVHLPAPLCANRVGVMSTRHM